MKLKMIVAVVMLLAGGQLAARDLAKITNWRELSNLVYSKLPADEQEQLLRLAVSSGLPAQVSAVRSAINKHVKNIQWNELENIYRSKGFNGVKVHFNNITQAAPTKAGQPSVPAVVQSVVKTPAIVQIEKQQQQIEQQVVKAEQEAEKKEQIAEQKQAEADELLQKQKQQQAQALAEANKKEAEGKLAEAEALRKKEAEQAQKDAQALAAKKAEAEKAAQVSAQKEQEVARLKEEAEKQAQELAAANKKAQEEIQLMKTRIEELVGSINLALNTASSENWFNPNRGALVEQRDEVYKSVILPENEKDGLVQEIDAAIQAIDNKLEAMQKEEAERKASEKKKAEEQAQKEAEKKAAEQQQKELFETLNKKVGDFSTQAGQAIQNKEKMQIDAGIKQGEKLIKEVSESLLSEQQKSDLSRELDRAMNELKKLAAQDLDIITEQRNVKYFSDISLDKPVEQELQNITLVKNKQDQKITKITSGNTVVEANLIDPKGQPSVEPNLTYWIAAHIDVANKNLDKESAKQLLQEVNQRVSELDSLNSSTGIQDRLRNYLFNGLAPVLKVKLQALEGK